MILPRSHAWVIALASAVSMAACSLGALDGFSGAPAADGGGPDTSGDGGSAANDSGSGSNVDGGDGALGTVDGGGTPNGSLFFDTFESPSGLCEPWSARGATALTNAGGHNNSAMACRVCLAAAASGGVRRLVRPVSPETTLPAGQYSFSVWMRDPAYQGSIAFEIYELTASSEKGPYLKNHVSSVASTWKPLQVTVVLPTPVPGFLIDLYLDEGPPATACFEADEALLVYIP